MPPVEQAVQHGRHERAEQPLRHPRSMRCATATWTGSVTSKPPARQPRGICGPRGFDRPATALASPLATTMPAPVLAIPTAVRDNRTSGGEPCPAGKQSAAGHGLSRDCLRSELAGAGARRDGEGWVGRQTMTARLTSAVAGTKIMCRLSRRQSSPGLRTRAARRSRVLAPQASVLGASCRANTAFPGAFAT